MGSQFSVTLFPNSWISLNISSSWKWLFLFVQSIKKSSCRQYRIRILTVISEECNKEVPSNRTGSNFLFSRILINSGRVQVLLSKTSSGNSIDCIWIPTGKPHSSPSTLPSCMAAFLIGSISCWERSSSILNSIPFEANSAMSFRDNTNISGPFPAASSASILETSSLFCAVSTARNSKCIFRFCLFAAAMHSFNRPALPLIITHSVRACSPTSRSDNSTSHWLSLSWINRNGTSCSSHNIVRLFLSKAPKLIRSKTAVRVPVA